jgi:hypothetical protein
MPTDPKNKPSGQKSPAPSGKIPGPPPLASEILANFKRPAVQRAIQPKQGPPQLASEVLKHLLTPRTGALQPKPGPPPLASEILAKFKGPHTRGAVQPKQGPPRLTGGLAKRVISVPAGILQPKFRPAGGPSRVVQLFKVDGKNYNNISKIRPLVTKVCSEPTFTGKETEVTYWLKQYVSVYTTDNFTYSELLDYLYDDIIREAKPIAITSSTVLTAQEMLTTEHGFKRIKTDPTVFPTGNIRFYRTMSLEELKNMLKTEGQTTEPTLPAKDAEIKTLIKSPRKLGNHVGDYKQARSYFKVVGKKEDDKGQALLQFTLSASFFRPSSVALPAAQSVFKEALVAKFGDEYQVSSRDQGLHDEIPGLKSESRGLYSVGLSAAAAEKFLGQCTSVKVIDIRIPS